MGQIKTKVGGPYFDRKRNKWRIFIEANSERCVERFDTKGQAQARIDKLEAANPYKPRRSVRGAIDDYEVYIRGTRQLREGSVRTVESFLRHFLGDYMDQKTDRLSADILHDCVDARLSKGLAVDTVASELRITKTWIRWASKKGWIASNLLESLDEIRVEGRRKKGKPQLTLDEARRFVTCALKRPSDVAVAVLVPLLMGADGHEILDRVVRDIDDDGRVLVIPWGKTANRIRRVEIPEVLQPLFRDLTTGKADNQWLFPSGDGGHRSLTWARQWTCKVCDAAKAPRVCPHGLRGTHASLAEMAGVSSHVVASTLGHANDRVTGAHYTGSGVREAARQNRLLTIIDGGQRLVKTG